MREKKEKEEGRKREKTACRCWFSPSSMWVRTQINKLGSKLLHKLSHLTCPACVLISTFMLPLLTMRIPFSRERQIKVPARLLHLQWGDDAGLLPQTQVRQHPLLGSLC